MEQTAIPTATRAQPRRRRPRKTDERQREIFPSEDEQREIIADNEEQAKTPDISSGRTFSAEKYRAESLERLRSRYSSYREYRTDGEESRLSGIAVARKHDGGALVLNPTNGQITDFTAEDSANQSDADLILSVIQDDRLKDGIALEEDRLPEDEERRRSPSRGEPSVSKGRRKRAYPSSSLPELKNWLGEKREGVDLDLIAGEIALREKEREYLLIFLSMIIPFRYCVNLSRRKTKRGSVFTGIWRSWASAYRVSPALKTRGRLRRSQGNI
jgi:hypothetical protein